MASLFVRGWNTKHMLTDVNASLNRFSNLHSAFVLLATLLAVTLRTGLPLAIEAFLMFGWLCFTHRGELAMHARPPGVANILTAIRLLLLLTVLALLETLTVELVFTAFAANVVLDVIDGRVSRAFGEESRFGSQFDMEVDAFFVLVAGLYFHSVAGFGLWVLIPGALRYVYRLAVWASAGDKFAETKRRHASIMAGVNFVLLCSAVLITDTWQLATLIVATLLTGISFSLSFAELARHVIENPSRQ